MTHYGARELAASFRTVRNNTLQIANDISENHYNFRPAPGCRTVAQTLVHIAVGPEFQLYIQGNKIDDLMKVNFPELMKQTAAVEAEERSKAEIVALLKSEGDRYARYLEGLSDAFLSEAVNMPPGADPATKSRLEMLLSPKEHEMHHRGQLMQVQRMLGMTPHLTRQMQERMARSAQAQAQPAHSLVTPRFSPKAVAFLRALKRNNDREWFKARKEQYEMLLRAPMIAIIEQLATDFRAFAPDLVANPRTSLYRIYRDTRFSDNKAPLKTNVAAVFPCRGLAKHQGAGLYFEIAPQWVWVGGGMYAPDTSQLQAVREHIAGNTRRLRTIVESPAFRRTVGRLDGERLQRVPRGFAKDHPAAEFLKYRQFLAAHEFPASFAYSDRFYPGLLKVFRTVAPLVAFLNEPLL